MATESLAQTSPRDDVSNPAADGRLRAPSVLEWHPMSARHTVPGSAREPSRRSVAVAALVAILGALWLYGPSLSLGYHLDDYVHVAMLDGTGVMPGQSWDQLFTFAVPGRDRLGPIQGDYLPWWSAEDLRLRFFRPLSGLTYALDWAAHGDDPEGFHATSLALYAALVAACTVLYGALARATGRGVWTVLVAALLFALAREHESNVTWIAGRNTLVSVLLCPPALLFYHRWRTGKRRADLVGALACFALALCANEAPVALMGFFAAYELSLGRGAVVERARALLPVAAVAGAWLVFYSAAGYGTQGSEWYVNPLTDPARFVREGLRVNLVNYLVELALPASLEPGVVRVAHPWLAALGLQPALASMALAALVLLALALTAVRDRGVRFALLGVLLALVPLAASPRAPRVMLLPTVGTSWAFAVLVTSSLERLSRPRTLALPWNALRLAVAAVLVAGFAQDPAIARYYVQQRADWAAAIRERALGSELPVGAAAADARVLLLTSPSGQEALIAPLLRLQQGLGWPAGIWGVSAGAGSHALERTGERTLRLSLGPGSSPAGMVPRAWAGLYRDDFDLAAGQELRQGALRVALADVRDGDRVFALDVAIDLPLDDERVWLMAFDRGGEGAGRWRRIPAPAVGERVELPY